MLVSMIHISELTAFEDRYAHSFLARDVFAVASALSTSLAQITILGCGYRQ